MDRSIGSKETRKGLAHPIHQSNFVGLGLIGAELTMGSLPGRHHRSEGIHRLPILTEKIVDAALADLLKNHMTDRLNGGRAWGIGQGSKLSKDFTLRELGNLHSLVWIT